MEDAAKEKNESIRFKFTCCDSRDYLTYSGVSKLMQGAPCDCSECGATVTMPQKYRPVLKEKLSADAHKGKIIVVFGAIWFPVGLVLWYLHGSMAMLPFSLLVLLIFYGFSQSYSDQGQLLIPLERSEATA